VPAGRMLRANNRSPMTLDGTRTFLLGVERPLVIDPGPQDSGHLAALERVLGGTRPVAILLTHAHADHAGNALPLSIRTGAPIFMGRGAPRLPFPEASVARWLEDGELLECESGTLEVRATPGHAPEHIVLLYRHEGEVRALFAGDLFLGVGDTTLVSHPDGNVADYLRSLEVVSELRPSLIYPAHGPALRRPERTIARYRTHRMERIEQVREARRNDPRVAEEELVARVYGRELDPRLQRAALGSVRAILEFLKNEKGGGGGPRESKGRAGSGSRYEE
jgi:glyoxylase-like metal-dependent hydrolase (beta-lactamase superfamily II)